MEDLMIKVDNVSKMYKLGQISGTTLRAEFQRIGARIKCKEDPTKKIGDKDYSKGETFMALNGVSFEVEKGERVGIIGHNGAGKSTLLKLLSRVTAPTSGEIGLNGRVASMLEVGTGFHAELTGRENIYMNGAILGMTKKEIDAKIEDIIEFSEIRRFIDTPAKRYSSGMYVKLAFSVAAHLDSEIMIMDEVLAVGDMAFQKKCLEKMNDVSKTQGRTILYVSHNMKTMRQLCSRVVVLEHGKIVYDGGVEEGISKYMDTHHGPQKTEFDFFESERSYGDYGKKILLKSLSLLDKETAIYDKTEKMRFLLKFDAFDDLNDLRFNIRLVTIDGECVGTSQTLSGFVDAKKGNSYEYIMQFDLSNIVAGQYYFQPDLFYLDVHNLHHTVDHPDQSIVFEVIDEHPEGMKWQPYFGYIQLNPVEVIM